MPKFTNLEISLQLCLTTSHNFNHLLFFGRFEKETSIEVDGRFEESQFAVSPSDDISTRQKVVDDHLALLYHLSPLRNLSHLPDWLLTRQ